MVVSKKDKKRRPLSVVVESSGDRPRRSPYKANLKNDTGCIDANHFEYIQNLTKDDGEESILARKFDNGKVYTVKLVRKSGHGAARLAVRIRNEQKALKLLTKLEISFVIRLWWSFEDEKAMYLVTDRTDGRELRTVIEREGPLRGRSAILCAAELTAGILGLQERGLVHTNLKPESVLIDEDGHVVISDFGNGRFLRGDTATYRAETRLRAPEDEMFHAPELVLGWDHDYGVDWWSFGLLLFWILTRSHPFVVEADNMHSAILHSKILHSKLMEDYPAMDDGAYRLVARCLQRNPALRIDGVGVKMHEYFHDIDWASLTTKRLPAPFSSLAKDTFTFVAMDPEGSSLGQPTANRTSQDLGQFSFSWQRTLPSSGSLESTWSRSARRRRQSLRIGDVTVIPAPPSAPADPLPDIPKNTTDNTPRTAPPPLPVQDAPDADVSILPNLDDTPYMGLPTPLESCVGRLRKYASLNFDDLDSLASTDSSIPAAESSRQLGRSESTTPLRKTKSILGISLESFRDVDDSASSGSGRWTKKLRKRSQAGTPISKAQTPVIPPTPAIPPAELPRGIEKIGSGIGYNHRGRRPALNLASLTPRTCHAIFSGRRSRSKPKHGEFGSEKDGARKGGPAAGLTPSARGVHELEREQGQDEDLEEDLMDEVMREVYGDEWNAGASPDPDTSGAGMPWGDVLAPNTFERAGDASFAGADSTLRLVTSPSTPMLR
ncbi:kinase-like protein [Dichomitus squalens]|uniref:Kinase-like protein n=1 Tax=Dichomitus squalens TaxID=114155 RepID=A0A4Q9MTX4_9APHY|nr:kinase-like protein [Dichomitus squalens]